MNYLVFNLEVNNVRLMLVYRQHTNNVRSYPTARVHGHSQHLFLLMPWLIALYPGDRIIVHEKTRNRIGSYAS